MSSETFHTLVQRITLEGSPYSYTPGRANTIAFMVVYAILTSLHVGIGIRFRYWSALATIALGGLLEVLGWVARYMSSTDPLQLDPFLMQIVCLILGPVFFTAWVYILLGKCITVLGPQYSLLKPRWYLFTFVAADVISLILQAVGGGQASINFQNNKDTTTATHIMLAGILFQLAAISIFVLLAADFIVRVILKKPYKGRLARIAPSQAQGAADEEKPEPLPITPSTSSCSTRASDSPLRKAEILLAGVALATVMIYVRGIYRSIELTEGWTGRILTTESYFIWLDGLPMTLCMALLALAHPAWLLPKDVRLL